MSQLAQLQELDAMLGELEQLRAMPTPGAERVPADVLTGGNAFDQLAPPEPTPSPQAVRADRYSRLLGTDVTVPEAARLAEVRRMMEAEGTGPVIRPMGVPEPPPDEGPQAADVIAAPPLPPVTSREAIALRTMRGRADDDRNTILDRAAAEAGVLGRFGANVAAGVGGALDQADATMARVTGAPPPRQPPSQALLGLAPEESEALAGIGERAGLVSKAAAGLVATPAMLANPIDAALMGVPGASPIFGTARRLGTALAERFGPATGARAERIVAELVSSGSGLGAFSALSAGMNYPAWDSDPEGGITAMTEAGAHGVQMGLLFGGAHAAIGGGARGRPAGRGGLDPETGRPAAGARAPDVEPSLAEIDAEVGQAVGQQRAAAESARAIETQARTSEQRRVERETGIPEWDDQGYRAGLSGEDINARIPTDPASAKAMAAGYARGIEERFGLRAPPSGQQRTTADNSGPLYRPELREPPRPARPPEPVAGSELVPTVAGSAAERLRAASGAPVDVGALPPSSKAPLPPAETMRQSDYVRMRTERDGADLRDWAPGEHMRAVRIALQRGERPVGMADYPDLAARYASPETTRAAASDQGQPAPVLDPDGRRGGAAAPDAAPGGAGEAPGPAGGAPQDRGPPPGPALDPVERTALQQLIRAPRKGEWSASDLDRRIQSWAESSAPDVDLAALDATRLRIEGRGEAGAMEGGTGEGGTAQGFDTKFRGPVPRDLSIALQHAPHLRMHVKGNQKWGNGADALARLGLDRYVETLEQLVAGKERRLTRAREMARGMSEHDPAAAFMAFVRDTLPAVQRERPKFDVMDRPHERLPHGAEFTINGERVRVVKDGEFMMLRSAGDGTALFHLGALDAVPIDRGSLVFPRRTPEQAAEALKTATDPLERALLQKESEGGGPRGVQEEGQTKAEVLTPDEVPDFAADVAADEAAAATRPGTGGKGADLSRQLDLGGREVGPVTGKQQELPLPEPSRLEREIADRATPEDTETMPFWSDEAKKAGGIGGDETIGPPPEAMGAAASSLGATPGVIRRMGQALVWAFTGRAPSAASIVTPSGRSALGIRLAGAVGRARSHEFPRLHAADESAGQAAVEYAASRDIGHYMAQELVDAALPKDQVRRNELGALVVEDNLRDIRAGFLKQAREHMAAGDRRKAREAQQKAAGVRTLIGTQWFKDNADYQAKLRAARPELARYETVARPELERLYKEASDIDPAEVLPTRGAQTGIRVNLMRAEEGDRNAVRFGGGEFRNPVARMFKKKSPFNREASGSAEAYVVDLAEITRNSVDRQIQIANRNAMYASLVDRGLAVIDKPGEAPKVGGENTVPIPIKHRVLLGDGRAYGQTDHLYVRRSLAAEVRAALGMNAPVRLGPFTPLAWVGNKTALFGLADLFTHVANWWAVTRRVGGNAWERRIAAAGAPLNILVGLETVARRTMKHTNAELRELAQAGALAAPGDGAPATKWLRSVTEGLNRANRLAMLDAYKELVRRGLVKDTPANLRHFVNQLGNYNEAMQGPVVRFLRQSGLGPFATAGTSATLASIRGAVGSHGLKASSPAAATRLWLRQIGLIAGTGFQAALLGYFVTGRFGGREGTPVGHADTGEDDERGRMITVDLFGPLGLGIRRGLRAVGAEAAMGATREEQPGGVTTDKMTDDQIRAMAHPAMGPLIRFAMTSWLGSDDPVGVYNRVPEPPPGESRRLARVSRAFRNLWQFGPKEEGESWPSSMLQQLGVFGRASRAAKPEDVGEAAGRVHGAQLNAYIDSEAPRIRRLPREDRVKAMRESAKKLDPRDLPKFYRAMESRRVLVP